MTKTLQDIGNELIPLADKYLVEHKIYFGADDTPLEPFLKVENELCDLLFSYFDGLGQEPEALALIVQNGEKRIIYSFDFGFFGLAAVTKSSLVAIVKL